ncbi:transcriptional regulator, LacI family [Chelatococcus sambhunathii]|uniref:Transcriptional regulator, LacI family n=1 Tax=Chelatococcus sambhunathii TaxID=363953 RepID=A0ABP2A2C0_9HYPH|nr:LacI family DNA-binding transcriptional regulator [Chelatococcus sambhunathii]CUA87471.1 transcriptional regulator, LacI family [Chelatococcus sambhunathii]
MTVDDTAARIRTTGKPRFVSAQDVAHRAGVSRSAVSRAFTPGASIAEETRKKVIKAAAELGYQVNDLARGLLANHSRLVGIVATKPEVGFRADLTAALAKALIRRGSVPLLINTGETKDELAAAQQTLFGHRAEATIILSGSPPASFVDLARRNGQPLVVIGRSEPETDHVMVDNSAAARLAARLFVARGFTRLGLAGSRSATPSIVEREQAFCDEAARLGARVAVARGTDTDYAGGLAAGRALLAGQPRPRAIFCVNDLVALGVTDAARTDLALAVPGDVAVIGFDDIPQADWLAYRLTTFRQDAELMAGRAVAVLDARQRRPTGPLISERIEARLVVRHSFVPKP